jgi:hypothetical protein
MNFEWNLTEERLNVALEWHREHEKAASEEQK